jgi:hypothetical protein
VVVDEANPKEATINRVKINYKKRKKKKKKVIYTLEHKTM